MLDLSKYARRSVYSEEYFVVVGDALESTTAVDSMEKWRKRLRYGPACTGIEETRFYSMTATLTEVRSLVAHFAGSCEVHQPDLDLLISDLDANL
jgi:hypothetical protein